MGTQAYPSSDALFYQQYEAVRKSEIVGILLALFLGTFGVHHFYLRRAGLGILYLVFFWTGVPTILGWIECFFMPGRVRTFNSWQAMMIAVSLGMAAPPVYVNVHVPPQPVAQPQAPAATLACANCGATNPASARFCSSCGRAMGQYLTA